MLEYLKFSLGNEQEGYKTICLRPTSDNVTYEIIHSGLLPVEKGFHQKGDLSDWLEAWEALNVSSWEEMYIGIESGMTVDWRLAVQEDGLLYRCGGSGEYPKEWSEFLEWLDVLMPEMEFIPPDRIETVILNYDTTTVQKARITESIRVDRKSMSIIVNKSRSCIYNDSWDRESTHKYEARDGISELLDDFALCDFKNCLRFGSSNPSISLKITRHAMPETVVENILAWIEDTGGFGWTQAIGNFEFFMNDLQTNLLSEKTYRSVSRKGEYIYCKVRFGDSFRLYSYITEDTSLEVGDVVKVPVGKDNTVGYGVVEEIGYYSEENAPYPVEKTKHIIGLHRKKGE